MWYIINILIYLLLACGSVYAYSPPVGIPDPGTWGSNHPIDTAAPDTATKCPNWPSAVSTGCYYIDSTAAGCDNDDNGTPDDPRCAFTAATTYAAGSYIEIHGGPYNFSSSGTPVFNGTDTDPIWFRGTPSSKPIITGELIPKGSYIFMENLSFSNGSTLGKAGLRSHNSSDLDHAVIRNSTFQHDGSVQTSQAVISIYGTTDHWYHDIVIYNNTISYYGKYNHTAENDFHGIKPNYYANNIWILNNTINHMGGDSVQVGEASIDDAIRPHHVYIGRNTFGANYEDDIDLKEADHIIISENDLGATDSTVSGADGGVLVVHNNTKDVWVINNYLHDNHNGAISTGADNLFFVGNIIENINASSFATDGGYSSAGRGISWYSTTDVYVVDNTIFDCDIGIQMRAADGANKLHGNIITGRTTSAGAEVYIADGFSSVDMDYLEVYNSGGEKFWLSTGMTDYDLDYVKTQSECTNCIDTAPVFASGYVPDSASPGTNVSVEGPVGGTVYDLFFSTYGLSIETDRAGSTRPQGSIWDIGAYEYNEAVAPQSLGTVLLGQ